MIRIEQEQDIEVLRQVALKLQREVDLLIDRIKELSRELSRLRGAEAAKAQTELDFLKELLARREQALFGDSSEKTRTEFPKEKSEARAPRRGHGPRPQPELPLIEKVHDLPETDRSCPECGGVLSAMSGQFEESEEITVVERQFVLAKHKRMKYRCRCNACVVTAPGPPKLQPGARYSPEFAVEVATSKYLDHLPLERQVRIMNREGLRVDSQTLWDQLNILSHHLKPTYDALGTRALASPLLHADETYWRLMNGELPKRWWVWGLATRDTAFYKILDNRAKKSAENILAGYGGTVMVDGYGVYGALSRAGPGFRIVHCWAHVRRKFHESAEHFPTESKVMLDLIRELYAVEDEAGDDLVLRARLRHERSRGTIVKIRAWASEQTPLPKSGLGRAISYMVKLWPQLIVFLDDPVVPLDNNAIERGLRGIVVGRKNHYGSKSRRGIEVAAVFYSLFETAKLCGVDPKAYVLKATMAAIAKPGTVTLPHDSLV